MQKKQEGRHIVDVLFVLTLFGVFTLSALVLVILGANSYKQTVSHMEDNYQSRTVCSYLAEKVRQNDLYDSISLGELADTEALVLSRTISDSVYCTYIYYYDGSLRELFIREGSDIGQNPLAAGTPIMELSSLEMHTVNDRLFSLTLITPAGEEKTLYLSSHSH